MPIPKLPKTLANVFAAAFSLGTDISAVADTETVLRLMAALHPDLPQIVAAQARVRLQRGDVSGARAMLTEAEARHPDNAVLKAMLAFCLFAQRDGLWQVYAREALALPPDAAVRGIVDTLCKAADVTLSSEAPDSARDAMLPTLGLAC